jgi:hypothetical protein
MKLKKHSAAGSDSSPWDWKHLILIPVIDSASPGKKPTFRAISPTRRAAGPLFSLDWF